MFPLFPTPKTRPRVAFSPQLGSSVRTAVSPCHPGEGRGIFYLLFLGLVFFLTKSSIFFPPRGDPAGIPPAPAASSSVRQSVRWIRRSGPRNCRPDPKNPQPRCCPKSSPRPSEGRLSSGRLGKVVSKQDPTKRRLLRVLFHIFYMKKAFGGLHSISPSRLETR